MKKSHLFILILSAIGLVFINYLITNTLIEEQKEHEEHQPMPLIYQMSFMQHFSTKLYLAGVEENWDLADFYSHELEEVVEELIEQDEDHHGIDIGKLTEALLLSQIELLEDAIDAKDLPTFKRDYQVLINSCNACHAATGHSMVKITIPTVNPYNQDFSISDQ